MKKYLGFDLGASSGRAIAGLLEGETLKLEEIYRFPNFGVRVFDSLYWDSLRLFEEIKKGLKSYVEKHGSRLDGVGIDSWGVDFVLLDENDEPVGPSYHYRDKRTNDIFNDMFKVVPREEIFNQTGIQFMQFNSAPQLFSMIRDKSPQLSITKTFLLIADYFNFLLSGKKCSEYSLATTSQLYDPVKKSWAKDLIRKLGLNPEWFPKIVNSGTILDNLHPSIANQTGLDLETPVIASLCHDTGAAIAAVPVEEGIGGWAYISSGTWSLMGLELKQPIINKKALEYNLTNEGGAFGTIRFLKNIAGLWLVQECKKIWEEENKSKLTYQEIMKSAEEAEPFQIFINPDHISFLNPDNMVKAIQNYCKESGQPVPTKIGEISRMIFEGLAFRYRQIFNQFKEFSKNPINKMYIVGGGSQNDLLSQFTSNVINLPVDSGPAEATTIGNILMQAIATKEIDSLQDLRRIVRKSFEIKSFKPKNASEWNSTYEKFCSIVI